MGGMITITLWSFYNCKRFIVTPKLPNLLVRLSDIAVRAMPSQAAGTFKAPCMRISSSNYVDSRSPFLPTSTALTFIIPPFALLGPPECILHWPIGHLLGLQCQFSGLTSRYGLRQPRSVGKLIKHITQGAISAATRVQ